MIQSKNFEENFYGQLSLLAFCQGRSYRGVEWGVTPPLLLKILFFLNAKTEKSTFSGVYSCSIYINKDITPPLIFQISISYDLRPPLSCEPSYAPVFCSE
jgi:hypothetical protein